MANSEHVDREWIDSVISNFFPALSHKAKPETDQGNGPGNDVKKA